MNGKRFIVFVLLVSLVITLALGVAHTRVALPLPDTDVGATSYDNRQADERQAFVYNSWKGQDSRTLNQEASGSQFTFVVTTDMRGYSGPGQYDTQEYFRGEVKLSLLWAVVLSWSAPATSILQPMWNGRSSNT